MADTTFVDRETTIEADWLNEVNDHVWSDTPVGARTGVHDASAITVTPTGGIAATDVQAALAELDTDKAGASATTAALAAKADAAATTAALALKASADDAALTGELSLNGSSGTAGDLATSGGAGNNVVWSSPGAVVGGIAADGVGSLALAEYNGVGDVAFGATVAGTDLKPCDTEGGTSGVTTLTGTWRCLGVFFGGVSGGTLWVRIS